MDNARDGAVPAIQTEGRRVRGRKKVKEEKGVEKPAVETIRITLPPRPKPPTKLSDPPFGRDEGYRPARGCGGAPGVLD